MSAPHIPSARWWRDYEQWWVDMGSRLAVQERTESFFHHVLRSSEVLEQVERGGGQVDYILFVLIRYWIPTVLPPLGRERLSKSDQDYWLESEQILKSAVARLRELKPLIELLTAPNPVEVKSQEGSSPSDPMVEVQLANMLEGIAEVAGSYGGPDYTSVIKNFDPIPLRQTQPFKHNKKNSAELWVVFLLREHFKSLGIGKDRYWSMIADLCAAAGISHSQGQAYQADELKAWWQKNWPRTYTQLEQKQSTAELSGTAYKRDFDWFQAWIAWQRTRTPLPAH
ncbi:MAG: hypothetical protein ACT4OO_00065 [Nitrospiraceae bacterium]